MSSESAPQEVPAVDTTTATETTTTSQPPVGGGEQSAEGAASQPVESNHTTTAGSAAPPPAHDPVHGATVTNAEGASTTGAGAEHQNKEQPPQQQPPAAAAPGEDVKHDPHHPQHDNEHEEHPPHRRASRRPSRHDPNHHRPEEDQQQNNLVGIINDTHRAKDNFWKQFGAIMKKNFIQKRRSYLSCIVETLLPAVFIVGLIAVWTSSTNTTFPSKNLISPNATEQPLFSTYVELQKYLCVNETARLKNDTSVNWQNATNRSMFELLSVVPGILPCSPQHRNSSVFTCFDSPLVPVVGLCTAYPGMGLVVLFTNLSQPMPIPTLDEVILMQWIAEGSIPDAIKWASYLNDFRALVNHGAIHFVPDTPQTRLFQSYLYKTSKLYSYLPPSKFFNTYAEASSYITTLNVVDAQGKTVVSGGAGQTWCVIEFNPPSVESTTSGGKNLGLTKAAAVTNGTSSGSNTNNDFISFDYFDVTLHMNRSGIPWTGFTYGRERFAGGLGSQRTKLYYASGFLTLQYELSKFLEQVLLLNGTSSAPGTVPTGVNNNGTAIPYPIGFGGVTGGTGSSPQPLQRPVLAPMPYRGYKTSEFLSLAGGLAPLIIVMSFLYSVSQLTKRIVEEKETRMREAMLIMGLGTGSFYMSWVITYMIQNTVPAILMSVLLKVTILPACDFGILLFTFWAFAMSTVSLSAIMGAFFSKSRIAALMSPVIFFLVSIPSFALPADTPAGAQLGLTILSPTAFGIGTKLLFSYEIGQGFQNGDIPSPLDTVNMAVVWTMLVVDTVIYFLLTLYLDAILPSEWGTRKHPLFCFTEAWYWFKRWRMTEEELEQERIKRQSLEGCRDGRDKKGVYEALPDPSAAGAASAAANGQPQPSAAAIASSLSPITVSLRGLRKEFELGDESFVAVDDLCLSMRQDEITVILGHNGAGKTTTINVMTGMLDPDGGDCEIYGHSILHDMHAVRQEIGFCPQHNILWPQLTCREHLDFFATLKGLEGDEKELAIVGMLEAVDLLEKEHVYSENLSGGQKRKLSVAIAFVGGNRMVFLDEPTAGMDVAARRFTWDLLKRMSLGRTIVLTTHYMDEADLLGSQVAIMAAGKLKCMGSPMFLKSRLGVGYTLTLACHHPPAPGATTTNHDESNLHKTDSHVAGADGGAHTNHQHRHGDGLDPAMIAAIDEMIRGPIPEAEVLTQVAGERSYRLPMSAVPMFPKMLRAVETKGMQELGVHSFGISVTTLEEIFLRIGHDDHEDEEEEHAAAAGKDKSGNLLAGPPGASGEKTAGESTTENPSRSRSPLSAASPTPNAAAKPTPEPAADEANEPLWTEDEILPPGVTAGLWRQFSCLMIKRFHNAKRDRRTQCLQVVTPLVCVLLAMSLNALTFPPSPKLAMKAAPAYGVQTEVAMFNCDPTSVIRPLLDTDHSDHSFKITDFSYPTVLGPTPGTTFSAFKDIVLPRTAADVYGPSWQPTYRDSASQLAVTPVYIPLAKLGTRAYDLSSALLQTYDRHGGIGNERIFAMSCNDTGMTFGKSIFPPVFPFVTALGMTGPSSGPVTVLFTNETFRHASPIALGLHLSSHHIMTMRHLIATVQQLVPGSAYLFGMNVSGVDASTYLPTSYTIHNEPMPLTIKESAFIEALGVLLISLFILIPFTFIPSTFVSYVVKERECKAKHLQMISGTNYIVYWISNFVFDILSFLITATLTILVFLAFNRKEYIGSVEAFGGIAVLFIFYGLAGVSGSYAVSFLFHSHATAQNIVMLLNFICGFLLVLVVYLLANIESTAEVGKALKWVFRIVPSYCLGEGIINLASREMFGLWFALKGPFDVEVSGYDLIFLGCGFPFYFGITLWLDHPSRYGGGGAKKAPPQQQPGQQQIGGAGEGNNAANQGKNGAATAEETEVVPLGKGETMDEKHPDKQQQNSPRPQHNTTTADGSSPTAQQAKEGDKKLGEEGEEEEEEEDEDVRREREEIERDDPSRQDDLVVVKHLRKVYSTPNGDKVAVKDLTFGVHRGEVFGFLGTNGAGKTTSISILCGEQMPTSGMGSIGGKDVVYQATEARRMVGYCPQFDALMDLLTPEEHLYLYAGLRGLPTILVDKKGSSSSNGAGGKKEQESITTRVVERLLDICDLQPHRMKPAMNLSGGNKRKLSVALSLIGGPDVVFLDEPSAGMDPKARRVMWGVIQKIATQCSVVLTTHHLEEVEVLSTRVSIMVDGAMKCIGPLQHLKAKFGSGFEMYVRVIDESHVEGTMKFIAERLLGQGGSDAAAGGEGGTQAKLLENRNLKLTYALPPTTKLSGVFEVLEEAKSTMGMITDYSISQTSLEQVFLRISATAQHAEDS